MLFNGSFLTLGTGGDGHHSAPPGWTGTVRSMSDTGDGDREPDDRKPDAASWGAGIAIGIGAGVAIGVAMGNLVLGIAIGAGIGIPMAIALSEDKRRRRGGGGS